MECPMYVQSIKFGDVRIGAPGEKWNEEALM
jgi:hypothetical protein